MKVMLTVIVTIIGNGLIFYCIYEDIKAWFESIDNSLNNKSINEKLKTPEELGKTFVNLGGA